MVRFLVLYGRPSDPATFDQHYLDKHIPLARKLPGLRRFTMSPTPVAAEGESPYHLVADLDFDDGTALQAALSSPEGKSTLGDLPNFASGGATILVCDVEDVTN